MEALSIRLLPDDCADGATNMACDEVLLRTAAESGRPGLRFYQWSTATVSLGYFQPASIISSDPLLTSLPWVRRPSGGATLVHHHELTYALVVPPGYSSSEPWMARMHRIIATSLARLGLGRRVQARSDSQPQKQSELLCFQQFTQGDLLIDAHKVVGSAQRKYHLALMQHGSILLAQSQYTPSLPGIHELAGLDLTYSQVREEVLREFQHETGWTSELSAWDASEQIAIARLVSEKYGNLTWNAKR